MMREGQAAEAGRQQSRPRPRLAPSFEEERATTVNTGPASRPPVRGAGMFVAVHCLVRRSLPSSANHRAKGPRCAQRPPGSAWRLSRVGGVMSSAPLPAISMVSPLRCFGPCGVFDSASPRMPNTDIQALVASHARAPKRLEHRQAKRLSLAPVESGIWPSPTVRGEDRSQDD